MWVMENYLPKYKSGDEGVIVNTASIAALEIFQTVPVYCVTKHGVLGFDRSLGGDEYYTKYKVRVLTICPGTVDTPLLRKSDNLAVAPMSVIEVEGRKYIIQPSEFIGQSLIEILKNGSNGSVWAIPDGNPPFEVPVPVIINRILFM